jgi:hypothetical protein
VLQSSLCTYPRPTRWRCPGLSAVRWTRKVNYLLQAEGTNWVSSAAGFRVRGDETNWLINKKNKTSALTASPSGNSIETWVSCRLIRAGWKINWRVTWFQSPSHHQLTAATVKMLTNETHRSGRSFPLSSQKCNQKIDIDIKSLNSRRKLRSINYRTIFCFHLLDADIQSI